MGTNQCAGDKIGNEAEIVDSLRYDHLGTPATSLGEVNVENFGSEGDGQTDDKVPSTMETVIEVIFSTVWLTYDPFSWGF